MGINFMHRKTTVLIICLMLLFSGAVRAEDRLFQEAGVSVLIPDGWQIFQKNSGDVLVALNKPLLMHPFNPGIVVTRLGFVLPMPQTKNELESLVMSMASFSKNVSNIENFQVMESKIEKKGKQGFSYKATYDLTHVKDEKKKHVVNTNHFFSFKGENFAVSLIAPEEGFKEYDKVLKKLIESFDVLAPTGSSVP